MKKIIAQIANNKKLNNSFNHVKKPASKKLLIFQFNMANKNQQQH